MALNWRTDLARYKKYFLNIRAMYEQRPDLKIFLEILLSLTTISLFAVFALRPTLLTISQLLTELEAKENTVNQLDTKLQNLKTAQTNYQSVQPDLPIIETAVPAGAKPELLIRQIEGLSNRNSVSITTVSVGEVVLLGTQKQVKKDDKLNSIPANSLSFPFAISVSGDYENLMQFLKDMENLRRLIVLDSISFNSAKTDSGLRLVLTITGRGLYEQ